MDNLFTISTSLLKTNIILFSVLVIIGSALVVILTIPRVIYIAYIKKLTAPIIQRSSHTKSIPSLGGVSFYITIVIFISLIQMVIHQTEGYNFIASLSILFMVGLKDDLVNSSAKVKLYGQLLASAFIVFSPSFNIKNLNGLLGIYELNPLISILLSILFLIFIINAYNLIDGIDGLASVIGIIISGSFIFLFYMKHDYFFMLLNVLTASVLMAFLRFNLSNGRFKIFMGDCGSLVIGMIIGACSLHYISISSETNIGTTILPENTFLVIISILCIPIFDTIRIILIRIIHGRSPFEADRNHLHHVLIDLGFKHSTSSILLGLLNVFIIVITLMLSKSLASSYILIYFSIQFVFLAYFFYYLKKKSQLQYKQ